MYTRWSRCLVCSALLVLLGATPALAQIVIPPKPIPGVRFTIPAEAESLARIADLDADGHPDLVLGVPCWIVGCVNPRVELRSGRNGALIASTPGGIGFGYDVDSIADLDGDGLEDVVVADRGNELGFVFSSNGLTQLASWPSFTAPSGSEYGFAISNVDDLDLDGVPEVAVGAPLFNSGSPTFDDRGLVEIVKVSPLPPTLIEAIPGPSVWDNFGESIVDLGDIDLDGQGDFAVGGARFGAPSGTICQSPGRVRVFAGGTPSTVLSTTDGFAAGDFYGWSAGALPDLDGDGRKDLIVGAIDACDQSIQAAYPYLVGLNGISNPPFLSLTTPVDACLSYGWAFADAGDWDVDGQRDFVVTAPDVAGAAHPQCTISRARVVIHSGTDGSVLWDISPTNATLDFGTDVAHLRGRRFAVADPGAGLIFVY